MTEPRSNAAHLFASLEKETMTPEPRNEAADIFDRLMELWQKPWSEPAYGEAQALVSRIRAALAAERAAPKVDAPRSCIRWSALSMNRDLQSASPPRRLSMTEPTTERLAALEHEQWMAWAQSVIDSEPGLSPERVARWRSLMVPYADLSEDMKEHDRKWAREAAARAAGIDAERLRDAMGVFAFPPVSWPPDPSFVEAIAAEYARLAGEEER